MPNPPPFTLTPGTPAAGPPIVGPQAVMVVVSDNNVLPDGSNPGTVDATSTLILTNVQGCAIAPAFGAAASIQIDAANNRRIIVTPKVLSPGASSQPFSFRVSCAGKTGTVTFSGSTLAPSDVSGVAWDGNAPTMA